MATFFVTFIKITILFFRIYWQKKVGKWPDAQKMAYLCGKSLAIFVFKSGQKVAKWPENRDFLTIFAKIPVIFSNKSGQPTF